jgi:peptide-methionine (R)-S-oxide reductase
MVLVGSKRDKPFHPYHAGVDMGRKVERTEEEWRKELSAEEYRVLRNKGTEAPFTGKYFKSHDQGVYVCAGCGKVLFLSDDKFDSGCGWPSFSKPAEGVEEKRDLSHGMARTEVLCPDCGGHLGHVFNDGPAPTGQRYCINSVSIKLRPKE